MKIFTTIADLKVEISGHNDQGKSIGFVPTMGALHPGHISLLELSKAQTDCSVVSIFVNPTQFNNPEDFDKYPITIEADTEKLMKGGCDILFLPSVKEMYPAPDTRVFDFDGIDRVMEGEFRPGHFNGVAQIVSKLFDAVQPDKAFFGQKDFQQLAIIKKMVAKLNYPVKIIACPIVRETDGLAMSSRNVRLSSQERKKALLLSQCLFKIRDFRKSKSVQELSSWVEDQFKNDPVYRFEYFRIVDDTTLQATANWYVPGSKVACLAVHVGQVRLIDNVKL